MKLPLWRRRQDAELDAEIRTHLEMAIAERVERGQTRADAEAAARREFGNLDLVRDVTRETWGWASVERLLQDVRYAWRTLVRAPELAAVALLTLALGIGATSAVFSVVDGVLLRPAPFDELDRLVVVWETDRNTGTTREAASWPDYQDFRDRNGHFEELGAFVPGEVNVVPRDGDPIRLPASSVTSTLFPMTGIAPVAGRVFVAGEDEVGGPKVALISESLRGRLFAQDEAAALGSTIRLDDVPHAIVGVLPDEADFGVLQVLGAAAYATNFGTRGDRVQVDVWTPLQEDAETLPRSTHPVFVLGRLNPGSSIATAQQEMSTIAADLEKTHPVNLARGVHVEELGEVVFGGVRPALLVLLAAVGLVLLVACANVANLLLARGAARSREIGVRTALGASPARLGRQFLVENLVLASLAAAVAVGVARFGLAVLVQLAPADVPRLQSVTVDLRVLGFTLIAALASGVVFGMVPAFQTRRLDLTAALKAEGGRLASTGRGPRRLRAALVVAEIGLASVLVVGAGLLVRTFWQLYRVDPGFHASGVLKAEYTLPPSRYPVDFAAWPDFREIHAFTSDLLARAAALPGVASVAVAGNHPLDPGFTNSFSIAGREAEAETWPEISVRRVSPGYFRTVGLPLIRGRFLEDSDTTRSEPVVVINEAAASRFFRGLDPVGARMQFWGTPRTIVGIVGDERFKGVAERAPIAVYAPISQAPSRNGAGVVLLRTPGDPGAVANEIRSVIRHIDPALAVFGVEPLTLTFSRSVSERRFMMLLIGTFAGIAILLSAVGVHGLLSYNVVERTREIGIRMALGAEGRAVVAQVFREGLTLSAAGLAIGLAGALAVTRLLGGLLFGVTPTDTFTFLAVPVIVTLVAVAASLVPARRATRVDPVAALKGE